MARSEGEVTVFGRSRLVRRYQPFFAFVPLCFWVVALVRTGEWWLFPYLVVASVAAAGAVRWWLEQQVVVLAPAGLRWSNGVRTIAVPWNRIISVAPMGRSVHVTWLDGTAVLSLPSQCCDFTGPAVPNAVAFTTTDAGTLGVAVRSAWLTRRGTQPIPTEPEPWTPGAIGSGAPVLQTRFVGPGLLVWAGFSLNNVILQSVPVSSLAMNLESAVQVSIWAAALGLLIRWWARVEVHDEEVVVRSFPFRRCRIPRDAVCAITTMKSRWTHGRIFQLALVTDTGTVRLPAPLTVNAPCFDDPDFYRIWGWLDRELCQTDQSGQTEQSGQTDHTSAGNAVADLLD